VRELDKQTFNSLLDQSELPIVAGKEGKGCGKKCSLPQFGGSGCGSDCNFMGRPTAKPIDGKKCGGGKACGGKCALPMEATAALDKLGNLQLDFSRLNWQSFQSALIKAQSVAF
jgi:hypothetical protein